MNLKNRHCCFSNNSKAILWHYLLKRFKEEKAKIDSEPRNNHPGKPFTFLVKIPATK